MSNNICRNECEKLLRNKIKNGIYEQVEKDKIRKLEIKIHPFLRSSRLILDIRTHFYCDNIVYLNKDMFNLECLNGIFNFELIMFSNKMQLAKNVFDNLPNLEKLHFKDFTWEPEFSEYGLNNLKTFICDDLKLNENSKDIFNYIPSLEKLKISGYLKLENHLSTYDILKNNKDLIHLELNFWLTRENKHWYDHKYNLLENKFKLNFAELSGFSINQFKFEQVEFLNEVKLYSAKELDLSIISNINNISNLILRTPYIKLDKVINTSISRLVIYVFKYEDIDKILKFDHQSIKLKNTLFVKLINFSTSKRNAQLEKQYYDKLKQRFNVPEVIIR